MSSSSPTPTRRKQRDNNNSCPFAMNVYHLLAFSLLLINLVCLSHSSILHKSFVRGALRNHLDEASPKSSESSGTKWTSINGPSDKWKRTGVRFLTRVKWENDEEDFGVAANDFHIIELETEAPHYSNHKETPEILRIHLKRKSSVLHPDLRVVVRDGDSEEVWSPSGHNATINCHFVGQVTTVPSFNSESVTNGLAILSACPPSTGFSGLIIMEDGRQWYIEPVDESLNKREKRETYTPRRETLEHVLLPHMELAGQIAEHISDVLRVPLPQLEEAARLAALDAEARRNMFYDWDDSDETLQSESSILTPFFHRGATLPFLGRGGGDRGGSGKMLSKLNQARKHHGHSKKSSPSGSSSSSQSSGSTLLTPLDITDSSAQSSSSASQETRTVGRQQEPHVVEIAVFTDEDLYDKMKSKFTVDTTAQLKEYATAMVNMMDVMYQHSSLGVDLRFKLVYLEVMKRKPTGLKTNGGKAKAYLSSFCDYAGDKNANSAQWDHALLLTGIDLHEEGVKTTAGLAWAGTMCFRYYSCSISEGLNFASAYITTHEIGHSLGMEHDGVGISETCDSTKYIMSPTTGPGKVTWSACSSSNLQDFIQYGTSELRGKSHSPSNSRMISRPICLEELVATRTKKSFSEETPVSDSPESDLKLPGEKYDANYQCSLGMGSFFKPHFERHKPPFDNICWILYCGNGTHAISTHPALEGTPCDRKKYCRAGQCVKKPET